MINAYLYRVLYIDNAMAETAEDRAAARDRFLDLTRIQVETGLKELGLPDLTVLLQKAGLTQTQSAVRAYKWQLHIACMVTIVLIILLSSIVYRVAVTDGDPYRPQAQMVTNTESSRGIVI